MNKSKKSMPAQLRKKMNKALRASALQPEPAFKSDRITAKDLLSRVPPKERQRKEAVIKALEKTLASKHKKMSHKHSKRTNSGAVDQKSSPHIVHVEGKRWIKTLEKQNVSKRKVFTRQMAKKGK